MSYEHDGPAGMSKKGSRHDNDHADIGKIQVLPTTGEVVATRGPYMPEKGANAGVNGYIDTQFRHLREESVASIIDACRSAIQLAKPGSSANFRQETAKGVKFGFFTGVSIDKSFTHEHNGAMFQLTFDCPSVYRGMGVISKAPVFQQGMLCALLAIDAQTKEAKYIFLEVESCLSTEAIRSRTGTHQKAGVQVTLADPDYTDQVTQLTAYLRKQVDATFYLVDMPEILVRSFMSHLKVLQELSVSEDFAFKEYIAAKDPGAKFRSSAGTFLPAPVGLAHNEVFNLNKLKKDKSDPKDLKLPVASLGPDFEKSGYLADIKERSTLDDGQAVALVECLSREMAFTQGPPGTGKTFLGVAMVETVLNSRAPSNSNAPIVIICQTNHALDDFMEELIARGITKVTRCGTGSTAKWMEPYLLRTQRNKRQRSGKEAAKLGKARAVCETVLQQATIFSEALNETKVVPWALVENHLREHHEDIADHFNKLDASAKDNAKTDIRAAKMKFGFAFMYWQEGGDIKDATGLISAFETMLGESQLSSNWSEAEVAKLKEEVSKSYQASVKLAQGDKVGDSLWSMNQAARKELATTWLSDTNPETLCKTFSTLHRMMRSAKAERSRLFDDCDVATIKELKIDVVGMTSTASATMRPLLEKIAPQVILFEEASELIEAHSTVALVPSVKHCIQIGDPLQLRPHVDQRELVTENNPKYRLDESLFQRFMNSNVPYSQLNTQRRAHPEMSDLLRAGDYPYLVDHPKTLDRPLVSGLAKRMWWFDHQQPEDNVDPISINSKSASNHYEVKFVSSLVNYLVTKQGYRFREITVITPYKGQLAALQKELSRKCPVTLTEKDHEDMIDAELVEDKEIPAGTVLSVNLSDMLRITTVDNYQGEQARVIIFSAVRSNSKNSIGFLANHNRVNVAISRAEDGFYVVGNSQMIEKDEHWGKVIKCFKAKDAIGATMVAQCQRHPQKLTNISQPFDFKEAQCKEFCNESLPCGHICSATCHSHEMHGDGRMPCKQTCTKKRDCGHKCDHPCGQKCGPCDFESEVVELLCGHHTKLKCGEILELVDCTAVVSTVNLECGHKKPILCSQRQVTKTQVCTAKCGVVLDCGHACSMKCSECAGAKKHTQPCQVACGRPLDCGHACNVKCHGGLCPPCQQPCTKSCEHGNCEHPCSQPCNPCVKVREDKGCEHSKECHKTLCCLPKLIFPCAERCGKVLKCGLHQCPGLCGELCSDTCGECNTRAWPSIGQITLPCQHTFLAKDLDRQFGMDKVYEMTELNVRLGVREIIGIAVTDIPHPEKLVCPTCGGPTHATPRYKLANELAGLHKKVEELVKISAQKLSHAFREVNMGEQLLFNKFDEFLVELKSGPMATAANRFKIDERIERLASAQNLATQARAVVANIEEAIKGMQKLLNSDHFPMAASSFTLRLDVLYFWSRLAMVECGHRIAAKFRAIANPNAQDRLMAQGYTASAVEQAAGECAALDTKIKECEDKKMPRLETEFRIMQLCFWSILQCYEATDRVNLKSNESFTRIRQLLKRYPTSAGIFETGVNKLDVAVSKRTLAPRYYELGIANVKNLWHQLGIYKGEHVLCTHKHIYSALRFDDCPECGHEVVPELPGSPPTAPHMMERRTPDSSTPDPSTPESKKAESVKSDTAETAKPKTRARVPSPRRTKIVTTPDGQMTVLSGGSGMVL